MPTGVTLRDAHEQLFAAAERVLLRRPGRRVGSEAPADLLLDGVDAGYRVVIGIRNHDGLAHCRHRTGLQANCAGPHLYATGQVHLGHRAGGGHCTVVLCDYRGAVGVVSPLARLSRPPALVADGGLPVDDHDTVRHVAYRNLPDKSVRRGVQDAEGVVSTESESRSVPFAAQASPAGTGARPDTPGSVTTSWLLNMPPAATSNRARPPGWATHRVLPLGV